MIITPFSIVLFGASLVVLCAAGFTWRRRAVPGGAAMAILFAAIGVWCFFSAMETTSTTEFQRYRWSAMSYLGLCNVTPLLLVFAIQYSDSRWRLSAPVLAAFWSVPAATLVLAFTNPLHHLIWTGISPGPISGTNTVVYHHGTWYFVEMIWFLLQSVVASFHIIRVALRSARLYILQTIVLLLCILFPWTGLLLFVLPQGPLPGMDTISPAFAVSAILIMVAVYRLRFLDLVPQARSTLIEAMGEGFLVLDTFNRIIDINSRACRQFGVTASAVGKELGAALPNVVSLIGSREEGEGRRLTSTSHGDLTLELSTTTLFSRRGKARGRLALIRDVTERHRAELERERLISELRAALASVKKLSGLLPICASCKKIRDDQGYWHQVERYVKDHSEAEFSHGICPECAARLYPELAEKDDHGPA